MASSRKNVDYYFRQRFYCTWNSQLLQVGSVVKVWHHVGCHCALKGTVKFIGAEVRIEEFGKGMAIVTADEIFYLI
jgi:hypothetical protein